MSSNAGERDVARRMGFGRRPTFSLGSVPQTGGSSRSLLDTLGVRSGMKAALVGVHDPQIGPTPSNAAMRSSNSLPLRPVDVLVFQVESTFALRRLRELAPLVKHGGALWVLWPREQSHISENHIQRSGAAAGLIDVAAIAVSDRLGGVKFVHGRNER